MNLKKAEKIIKKELPSWKMETHIEDEILTAEGERELGGKNVLGQITVTSNGGDYSCCSFNLEYKGDDIYEIVNEINNYTMDNVCVSVDIEENSVYFIKSDWYNDTIPEKNIIDIFIDTLRTLSEEDFYKLTKVKLN